MIILSEKQTKLLIPVKKSEWRSSSQKLNFYDVGEDKTVFRLQAKLNDGHIKWTGIFEDRDDADEFLYAMAKETLKYDKFLWSLCFPNWNPELGENLVYEFATITYRTTTGAGTFTVPSDWNNGRNKVETIAGGGGGGSGDVDFSIGGNGGGGGGGGAYSAKNNVSLTRGASLNCSIGTGGSISTAGGDTWIRTDGGAASAPTSVAQGCLSKGGGGGNSASGAGGGTSASGGAAASGYGDVKYSGGNGGGITDGRAGGKGGGGSGGPNGNGANGGASNGNAGTGGGGNGGGYAGEGQISFSLNGGKGGNNYLNAGGGAGGTSSSFAVAGSNGGGGGGGYLTAGGGNAFSEGANGGAGIEWDSTHGSGGAGGGGSYSQSSPFPKGGNGGLYGAAGGGGGGSDSNAGAGGTGAQGIIVAVSYPNIGFNMPMLGM